MKMSRVHYRKPVPLPDWVQERKDEISGRRTPAQVRRCLKDWMLKSDRLEQKKYLNRPLTWSKDVDPTAKPQIYPYGPEETIAYSNYFFPGRYAVLQRLLGDVKTMLPEFVPRRIIDFGCGPGTGAAVAVEVFGRDVVKKYSGVDMSQSMQDAAQVMTQKLGIDCVFWAKTSDLIKRAINDDYERYDLAICSYTLVELANDPARRAAVQILFELLDCGGVVVFVEKGNPEGSFAVRTARELLLSLNDPKIFIPLKKKKSDKQADTPNDTVDRPQYVLRAPQGMTHMETDIRTLAPCTHDKPCPLALNFYCSFSQKVFTSFIHDQQAEKFSYVIMQKRKRAVFVKEKSDDKRAEEVKTLQTYIDTRKDRHVGSKSISFEIKLHSRRSGGVWLDEVDETTGQGASINDFPTPLTILRRFQSLGPDSDKPIKAGDEKRQLNDNDENEDDTDDMEKGFTGRVSRAAEMEFERDMNELLNERELDMDDDGDERPRKGGRKPRPYPVRLPGDDDGDYEEEEEEEDTIPFEKPRTRVDDLVDELVDEIDWEEYNPPLYRGEWGRILRYGIFILYAISSNKLLKHRTPLKNKGHIIMDLCMPSGDIVRSTFARSNIQPVPQLYKALRKTSWGGLFPSGAGDEDNFSILMKHRKKSHTGMSATRVQQRLMHESELLERNSTSRKVSAPGDSKPLRAGRRRQSLSEVETSALNKGMKELIVPGKDVPFHSKYLRSKEYVNRDEISMMEKEKEMERVMRQEAKQKSISKMGESFRKRQEAKRLAEEADAQQH